jgi:hypothetical protein
MYTQKVLCDKFTAWKNKNTDDIYYHACSNFIPSSYVYYNTSSYVKKKKIEQNMFFLF